jgi:N-methylhydantoinase A
MSMIPGGCRVGVDIGGTFTDIVVVTSDGVCLTKKVSSTPSNFALGIANGLGELLAEHNLAAHDVEEIIHATTVATNAIIEHKGAKTALLTTRGFRDVLEFRRGRIPDLYNLFYTPPPPLVERRLRLEVDERTGAKGEVVVPLDEASVIAAVDRLRLDGVEAVAVVLLHSYQNPAHERRVGEILRDHLPGIHVSLSADVLPEIREYERTSTTVINAYIGPLVKDYFASLQEQLGAMQISARLLTMQSNGGIMSAEETRERPVAIVESGPAAGVIGAHRIAQRAGFDNVIAFDMGGTTAKASMIENGEFSRSTETEVGGGPSLASRLIRGRGYALNFPVLDIAEVGAGGGSLAWLDRGAFLKVGPKSAGAVPGPVCYGAGGEDPTVTDANVVLGFINPNSLAGGAIKVRTDLAEAAINERVALPLGLTLLDAARGIYTVANESMIRAIKAISTHRGRDPRDFALLAFGGSGPIHAVELARALEMKTVIVPPSPGLLSAVGLLEADMEYHCVQTYLASTIDLDPSGVAEVYDGLEVRAREVLTRDAATAEEHAISRFADLRYVGQTYELTIPVPAGPLTRAGLEDLNEAFGQEHERTYGHRARLEPTEIVNLRLIARAMVGKPVQGSQRVDGKGREARERQVYFGSDHGAVSAPVLTRSQLTTESREGPLIVEEYDTTTVVPPGCGIRLDEWNNMIIELQPADKVRNNGWR